MITIIDTTNKPSDLYSNIRAGVGSGIELKEATEATIVPDAVKNAMEKAKADADKAEADKLSETTTEEDDSNERKILGIPRGIAIGVGVVLLAIGGFIYYKKRIAKAS